MKAHLWSLQTVWFLVYRLGFCMKNEYIRSLSIIIPLRWRVWGEQAHFCLIESICSLFSMVLFFCCCALTHASESPMLLFFLSKQGSRQWPSKAALSTVSGIPWARGCSVCSGEIQLPQSLYRTIETGTYKVALTCIVMLQIWHELSKRVILSCFISISNWKHDLNELFPS